MCKISLNLIPCMIFFAAISGTFMQCASQNEQGSFVKSSISANEKQKGAHVFGGMTEQSAAAMLKTNIDWLTIVPYAGQSSFDSPTLTFQWGDSLDQRKREARWNKEIEIAHAAGLKVFMKPHVWLHTSSLGKWRSDIYPTSEEHWNSWAKDYKDFILYYAKLAQKNNVDLYCIGAELTRLSLEKPEFWSSLIQEVRKVYSGELTYAANWYEEYETIAFWDELDYIGVQAYFPLVDAEYPKLEALEKAWQKYIPVLAATAEKYDRKILFTEIGYKSTSDCAKEPWQWLENFNRQDMKRSVECQANSFQALFNTIWDQDWFAGIHIWQYRSEFFDRQSDDKDFFPQGKPAAVVIRKGFE